MAVGRDEVGRGRLEPRRDETRHGAGRGGAGDGMPAKRSGLRRQVHQLIPDPGPAQACAKRPRPALPCLPAQAGGSHAGSRAHVTSEATTRAGPRTWLPRRGAQRE